MIEQARATAKNIKRGAADRISEDEEVLGISPEMSEEINETIDEGINMLGFLPTDYEVPKAVNNYMKFEQGVNRFRVLSSAVVGNVFWATAENQSRRPIRRKMDANISGSELGMDKDGRPEKVKHFWAFVVWNYQDNMVQILEITQKTIMTVIEDLVSDSDWGDPKKYDITVTKKGEKLETEYTVKPHPAKDLDEAIADIYKEMDVNLEELFAGGDPFSKE